MEIRPKIRILLLALAACVAFPFFFTETLVVVEIEHDCCTKEETQECITCLHMLAAINLQLKLKIAALVSSSFEPLLFSIQINRDYNDLHIDYLSPVELKVRFNS